MAKGTSNNVRRQLTAGNNLSCSLCQLVGLSCGKHQDVLSHIEWVLHQLYPIIQSNHTFIELILCREECYVDNQMW